MQSPRAVPILFYVASSHRTKRVQDKVCPPSLRSRGHKHDEASTLLGYVGCYRGRRPYTDKPCSEIEPLAAQTNRLSLLTIFIPSKCALRRGVPTDKLLLLDVRVVDQFESDTAFWRISRKFLQG